MITNEMIAEAMQTAWNDFCTDAKAFPDCFKIKKGKLSADFNKGNFSSMVTSRLNYLLKENFLKLIEQNQLEIKEKQEERDE